VANFGKLKKNLQFLNCEKNFKIIEIQRIYLKRQETTQNPLNKYKNIRITPRVQKLANGDKMHLKVILEKTKFRHVQHYFSPLNHKGKFYYYILQVNYNFKTYFFKI
jgi:hypothetical protein